MAAKKDSVTVLYPPPRRQRALEGLHLAHDLRQYSRKTRRAYIYANFVTSIDGRIAIPRPDGGLMVPRNTSNPRDWRLYQELAAQADVLLTTGRYLRDLAEGHAQPLDQLDEEKFADLREWRTRQGLKPYPDTAIVSDSLHFKLPGGILGRGRRVLVLTGSSPEPKRVQELAAQGAEVLSAGENRVEGGALRERLTALGYQTVYSAAGPQVLHTLLAGGALDRLYLTFANRILGGKPFASVVEGPLLEPAVDLELASLAFDPVALDGLGQLLACYDVRPPVEAN